MNLLHFQVVYFACDTLYVCLDCAVLKIHWFMIKFKFEYGKSARINLFLRTQLNSTFV